MKAAAVSLLALGASLAAAQNVVHFPISRPARNAPARLARRDKTVTETLLNGGLLYIANVTVGTPPQPISLQIDTGSSDIWMVEAGASLCDQDGENVCIGGTFDASSSSTFQSLSRNTFDISYVDGTGVTGDYFVDTLSIGPTGSTTTIKQFEMALANNGTIGTGIMGVGFAADESICSGLSDATRCKTHPTLTQQLVSQGYINSQAYSLWLNDLDSNTGNILFGGVDTSKFKGNLITLPVQPDSQSGSITSFTVAWTNLTLGTPNGDLTGFVPNGFVSPAILDSGTTLTLLPDNIAAQVLKEFGAIYSRQAGYLAPCSLASSTATFDFGFGGPNGPTIRVPISEFLIPLTDEDGNPVSLRGTSGPICQVGVDAAGENPILFGDTFLRSAYVVYDLDNKQISLAQAVFNSTSSNIVEIKSGSVNNVPNASGTATGASIVQTETRAPGFFGGIFGGGAHSATAGVGGALTSQLNAGTGAPLAQYTAANTNNPAPNSGGATSKAAAAPGATAQLKHESLWMSMLVLLCMGIGSATVFL